MMSDFEPPMSRLVNFIMTEAVALRATEIRLAIEKEQRRVVVSYLVGDVWEERDAPPSVLWTGIVARLCSLAKIDGRVAHSNQHGTIFLSCGGLQRRIEVRIDSGEEIEAIHLTVVT